MSFASNNLNGQFEAFNINQLETVDISDNGFTGSLPSQQFGTSTLSAFVGAQNCFSGPIPEDICNAHGLVTLDLSGLTAGRNCARTVDVLGILKFYTASTVSGDIPACLFTMPNITNLYLSGNGIYSELNDIPSDSLLTNISLSYNRLHGTIPVSIQQQSRLDLLDLSFNQLSGTIEQMNSYNVDGNRSHGVLSTTVHLESNRLSGDIPQSFADAENIDILDGNMYSCISSLPQQDPNVSKFSCGSSTLNGYLNTFLCLFGIVAIISMYKWCCTSSSSTKVVSDADDASIGHCYISIGTQITYSNRLNYISTLFSQYCMTTVYITVVIVVFFIPLYIGLKMEGYSTHTDVSSV